MGTKEKFIQWLKAAAVRAVKTVAQTAVATIPAAALTIGDIDWMLVIGASLLAGVISLLTSVAGIPEVDDGEPLPKIVE